LEKYIATISRLFLFIFRTHHELFLYPLGFETLDSVAESIWKCSIAWDEQLNRGFRSHLQPFFAASMLMPSKTNDDVRLCPAARFTAYASHLQFFAKLWVLNRLDSYQGPDSEKE
jgi:hypothetical protein